MKPFYSRYVASLGALLLLALSLIGCQDTLLDRTQPDPASPEQIGDGGSGRLDGAVTVSIAYDTPALRTPQTRALTVEQESELMLATTRVMVFNSNNEYQYDARLTKITPKTSDHQQGTLTVQIKPGQGLGIVVLANLTEADKVRTVSGTKSDILKSFAYSVDKNTNFSSVGIPMFGEVTQVEVKTDVQPVPTLDKTIHLLRAVARVDVGLKMSAVGTSGKDSDFDETAAGLISTIVEPANKSSKKVKWTLLETKFFNAASAGLVAPSEGKYTVSGDKPKATAPSLPATPGKQDLTYAVTDNLLKRNIYVPEVDNPSPTVTQSGNETDPTKDTYYLNRPYLILKLQYDEVDDSNNVKAGGANGTTYFRVDFLKREGEEATAKYTYLPLLRNYRYKVDVQNIGGLGFDNEDDAKKGPSANIMYNVLVWDESEMSNVKYDGQYMLGVSKNIVETYKSGGSMQFKVQTSWPEGFRVEGLPEGFTVLPAALPDGGTANTYATTEQVSLAITPPNNWAPSGEEKTDEKGRKYKEVPLTIVAGRMKWNVQVRQYQFDKVDIQLFRDRDLTQPVEFLTIHELGKAMLDPSITDYRLSDFDNKMYYGTNQLYIDKYNKADGTTLPATSAPWFDMDKANKASGSKSDFTALTSGAVRVFYAKIDAPAGSTFTFGPKDGGKGHFIVKDISATADPALPADIHMFMVTAEEMTNVKEFFEINSDEYVFKVKAPDTSGSLSAEATINFDQREYDAAIFTDQEMSNPLFGDSDDPVLLLNGETVHYKLKSNASYYSVVLSQRGSDVTPMIYKNGDGTLKDNALGIVQVNGKSWKTPVTGDANFNGDPFDITLRDDLTDSKVFRGYADLQAKILGMPFHYYKARVKEIGLISADFIQEHQVANSYQLVVNGAGIFIPIEKWINDAADQYNSKVTMPYFSFYDDNRFTWAEFIKHNTLQGISHDDHAYSELLWTDAYYNNNAPTGKVVGPGTNTPFLAHEVFDYKGKLYLFVKPGNLAGNSVIAIRSTTRDPKIPYYKSVVSDRPYYHDDAEKNKAILWSFHFVVYRSTINTAKILNRIIYTNDRDRKDYKPIFNNGVTRRFFNRNYGALISADEGGDPQYPAAVTWKLQGSSANVPKAYKNTKYEAQGMGYQWGRKDPIPLIYEGDTHKFYREDGTQVNFTLDSNRELYPSRTAPADRMSVRETIERPMYFVCGRKGVIAQGFWMAEAGYAPENYVATENSTWQSTNIWGGNGNVDDSGQRSDIVQTTRKTNFDPSPYGFAVPSSGFEFGRYFQGSTSEYYYANISALLANTVRSINRSFTQYTDEAGAGTGPMKWLTANCYETRDAPSFNIDASVGGLANNASATNRSSLTPYRPVLQIEYVGDWKQANKIPLGNDAINNNIHVGKLQYMYNPIFY